MSDGDSAADEVKYEGTHVGMVTHYYDKISVAVIQTDEAMKTGEKIKIYDKEGNVVVEQEVASMQINGKDLKEVEAGTEFGLKVEGVVKDGYTVYRQ